MGCRKRSCPGDRFRYLCATRLPPVTSRPALRPIKRPSTTVEPRRYLVLQARIFYCRVSSLNHRLAAQADTGLQIGSFASGAISATGTISGRTYPGRLACPVPMAGHYSGLAAAGQYAESALLRLLCQIVKRRKAVLFLRCNAVPAAAGLLATHPAIRVGKLLVLAFRLRNDCSTLGRAAIMWPTKAGSCGLCPNLKRAPPIERFIIGIRQLHPPKIFFSPMRYLKCQMRQKRQKGLRSLLL